MRFKITCIVFVVFVLFSVFTTFAQEAEKDPHFLMWDTIVAPSKINDFENSLKEQIKLYKQYGFERTWTCYNTDDGHYYFQLWIKDLDDIDDTFEAFEKVHSKMGKENRVTFFKNREGTYVETSISVVRWDRSLSYRPENLTTGKTRPIFHHWDYIYIQGGKQQEATKRAEEWLELYKEKKIDRPYNHFVVSMGADMPMFVVVNWAKDAAEYYANKIKRDKIFGEKASAIWDKTVARKVDHKNVNYRPDLSLLPDK